MSEPPGSGAYGGTVIYTNASGVDTPLSIYKAGNEVLPYATWHGAYDKGTCPATVCDGLAVDFPAGDATVFGEPPAFRNGPPSWYGAIITGMTDGSGYQYKRNRYYDPATGQFTQEDPIGLAGGLNVYGYANGDPANYSDPFGLCAGPSDLTCKGQVKLPGVILPSILGGMGGAAKRFWDKHGADIVGVGLALISDGMSGAMPAPESVELTPATLRGKSMQEVDKMIPETWTREPTARGGGTRYKHPTNRGEQIRVQPGTPTDPNPAKQGPYCRISRCGQVSDPIPLKGNPTLPPNE